MIPFYLLIWILFLNHTATKRKDKKPGINENASESEEDGDESPVEKLTKKETSKKPTHLACKYLGQ
jgi:hypothetical protein